MTRTTRPLTPAQTAAILGTDPLDGALSARTVTLKSLETRGLAFRPANFVGDSYRLTAEGHRVRASLPEVDEFARSVSNNVVEGADLFAANVLNLEREPSAHYRPYQWVHEESVAAHVDAMRRAYELSYQPRGYPEWLTAYGRVYVGKTSAGEAVWAAMLHHEFDLTAQERDALYSADTNADATAAERGFEPHTDEWYEVWLSSFEFMHDTWTGDEDETPEPIRSAKEVVGLRVAPDGTVDEYVSGHGDTSRAVHLALGEYDVRRYEGQVFEYPCAFYVLGDVPAASAEFNDWATVVLTDALFDWGTNDRARGPVLVYGLAEGKDATLAPDVAEYIRALVRGEA